MKTYHLPLLVQVIQWVFIKEKTIGKALELLFKTYDLNFFDKKIISQNTYEIIRYWRYLVEVNNGNGSFKDENIARIIAINLIRNGYKLPPHPALERIHAPNIEKKLQSIQSPAIRSSYSDWVYDICTDELGNDWHQLAQDLNQHYQLTLRVNTLKANREDIYEYFIDKEYQCELSDVSADGIVFTEYIDVFNDEIFKEGMVEIQDIGSQVISLFANPKPGQRVVDACAGAGGKTLHLAALMQNKGKIIALDKFQYKLDELKKRYKKAGVENLEIKLIENSKVYKRLYDSADIVLIDAPCSGLGVLKRNPDIKWRLKRFELEELIEMQKNLLHTYSQIAKVGGHVIYATCSVLPSENEKQIENFLLSNSKFELEEEQYISPKEQSCDGFYMAKLKRIS